MNTYLVLLACTLFFLVLAYRERAKYMTEIAHEDGFVVGAELDALAELFGLTRKCLESDARLRARCRFALRQYTERCERKRTEQWRAHVARDTEGA